MRLRATVRITIPGAEQQTDDAFSFWQAFYDYIKPVGEPDHGDSRLFAQEQEARIRQLFPWQMEADLRGYIFDITIIVRSITYSSLNIGLDVISKAVDGLGFSTDDILALLSRYTPSAILYTYQGGAFRGDAALHAEAIGQVIEETPKEVSGVTSASRIDKIWTIANLSLVIPSVVMLVAAYLIFLTAAGERNRITDAILKEGNELDTQRQKSIDRAYSQQKGFEDNLNAQLSHIRDLYQLEIEVMKARLDQIKEPNKQ